MKFFVLFGLVCVTSAGFASHVCKSKRGENLVQFNRRTQKVLFPCKYWALRRQQCGKYLITLSPGNHWVYPKYQLNTLWLGIENKETGSYWEGRTTNKLAVKYLNSEGARDLFNQKDGTVATSDEFEFGRDEGVSVFLKDKEDTFKVTFIPWDPHNRRYFANSDWEFECFDDSAELNEYPRQMCGSDVKKVVEERANEFGIPDRFRDNIIFFDTFTNPEIVHDNCKCKNATDILINTCQTDEQRINAINNCEEILAGDRHTECVTNYNCDPMDVFNACLLWGCSGEGFDPANKEMCEEVAQGIDFCPEFGRSAKKVNALGNLTMRVEAANCYKDFLPIRVDVL